MNLPAANSESDVDPPYAWTVPYTSTLEPLAREHPISTYSTAFYSLIKWNVVSPIPSDLRHQRKPVHTLLSPASAGLPGDDIFDISLIREEWIKNSVHEFIDRHNTMRLR